MMVGQNIGRITSKLNIEWIDYKNLINHWNPMPALEAWGSTENLSQSFNGDRTE